MNDRSFVFGLVAASALAAPLAARGGEPEEDIDILIGRSSGGVLAAQYDFGESTVLEPVSGLFNGWAGDEPGFEHTEADDVPNDFLMLQSGANIVFELVSIDPALVGNPLTDVLDTPGEQLVLGDELLHRHIEWLIDSDDTEFDPLQTQWQVDFKLIDTGSTNYADSQVYTWTFTNVPEPASALLMLGGVALSGWRRR